MGTGKDQRFRIGLAQFACSLNPEENLRKRWRESAKRRRGRADRLSSGAVPVAVLLPRGELPICSISPSQSRAQPRESFAKVAKELKVAIVGLALRTARGRGCITTRLSSSTRTARCSGMYRKMHIPDDPLYFEKYYFTPGDLGFPEFRHHASAHRHAGLLGPVVSRRRPAGGAGGAPGALLSHRDRLASLRESRVRRGAARCVAHHPARARHRQRAVCRAP